MTSAEIKETLEKQLQLLSERSSGNTCDPSELASLSEAMVSICLVLQNWGANTASPVATIQQAVRSAIDGKGQPSSDKREGVNKCT